MSAKVFFFISALVFVMQIEANPLYGRDLFRRLDMRPRMDEHPEAYIRRRLETDLKPMMDETPDEYIARRDALLYRKGLCEDMAGAGGYCRKWIRMCASDKIVHYVDRGNYEFFTDTLCSATCHPERCS
ncbi:uncharacterized protein LOC111327059 isoform X1 [Stylophora pistillata]|uniref:Uncharacterized protein n=1 Tax=Stylophora pistillata TaxID=50429 RepID=A0A2B4SES2_STYPI|nr:uncharacterized protein LOC111327059 isoform X1 [Stylophora pistillata]PFX27876.1 hypothetical protein AWC38_SpisGene7444 [Stylophora pistillata]